MAGFKHYAVIALVALIAVAIAFRIEFTKNLLFGTTTATK